MELESIFNFLENKTLLVTGATGFLSKTKCEELYLLVRATDEKSANQRLQDEIIAKELFRVLKQKMGENFESFIADKVKMVSGDIASQEDLDIRYDVDDMFKNLDVIINLAANTNFYERYDVSLLLNTFGAKNVLDFAKKCINLKVLVHVSTAYVCGEREGLIVEKSYKMGETLNETQGVDVAEEKSIVMSKLIEVQSQGASPHLLTLAMKEFGLERARKYGWPNTYVFTKALGEMLLMENKQHFPLVIIRPTIVTSTYKEPFPGWVEGLRTIDSFAVGYGKGRLTFLAGDPDSVLDVIPGDMVVNATLAAMVAHASQVGEPGIYHVGSSAVNPFNIADFNKAANCYFRRHPLINKEGKPIIVGSCTVLGSVNSFHKYLYIHYLLPLKALELVNKTLCGYFERAYTELKRKIDIAMKLLDIYEPYLFFKGVFCDMNTVKLRMRAREGIFKDETDVAFYFDVKEINWEEYFLNTHFPGLVKHVLKK